MNTDKPGAPYYQRSVEETLASVQSSPEGISGTEAATRLQQYGENALPQKPGKPAWLRFIAHFNDVLIYVLLAAALLKAVMGHWIDMAVILAVAVVNALIGFIQESNAENRCRVSAICCPARRWRSVRATMKPSPPPRWYLGISW